MVVVVVRKAQFACHDIASLVLSLLIFIYHIFIGLGFAAKDRPQMSQQEGS